MAYAVLAVFNDKNFLVPRDARLVMAFAPAAAVFSPPTVDTYLHMLIHFQFVVDSVRLLSVECL